LIFPVIPSSFTGCVAGAHDILLSMITKRRLLFLSGILIVLNAVVFGLPFVYESSLNIILGLFIVVIAFLLGRTNASPYKYHGKREKVSDIYAENRPEVVEDVAEEQTHLNNISNER